jgi:hypothetical protein
MADTAWEQYGVGRNPACDNCMAHCGYEGTAVDDAFAHPIKALLTSLRGPRVTGPMAPELPILYGDRVRAGTVATVSVDSIKRAARDTDGGHTVNPR